MASDLETSSPTTARGEMRIAALSLVVSIVLLAAKFAAYLLTNSSAIFSDALESIVNVLASAGALYSIYYAHLPADESHPYGHGKIEFVSAGFEGGMMMIAAVVMVLRAVEQLYVGSVIVESKLLFGAMLLAGTLAINGVLGTVLLRRGRSGGSLALEADGKHLLADAVTSAVVLVALLAVVTTGWKRLDPIAAIVVALWVAREAYSLLRRSAAGLMDEQDLEDDRVIRDILDGHVGDGGKPPHVCSYHKLRHRHSGRFHWVDFHIMVPSTLKIDRGHEIASAIELEIETALGEADATAHIEPCAEPNCSTCYHDGGIMPSVIHSVTPATAPSMESSR